MYCQSCDLCQRTAPKGRLTKVPLGEMPVIEIPFDRIAVDLVGPLFPCSERGQRYILVMVNYAKRYPEAVPMKYNVHSPGRPKRNFNRSRNPVYLKGYERGKPSAVTEATDHNPLSSGLQRPSETL